MYAEPSFKASGFGEDSFFIYGGREANGSVVDDLWSFDPVEAAWISVPYMLRPDDGSPWVLRPQAFGAVVNSFVGFTTLFGLGVSEVGQAEPVGGDVVWSGFPAPPSPADDEPNTGWQWSTEGGLTPTTIAAQLSPRYKAAVIAFQGIFAFGSLATTNTTLGDAYTCHLGAHNQALIST